MHRISGLAKQCYDRLEEHFNNQNSEEFSGIELIQKAILNGHRILSEPKPVDPKREEAFNEFWKTYKKPVGKDRAKKIFMKLKKEEVDQILSTVSDFVLYNLDVQFRPHPATYLNQRRWEDELKPSTSVRKPVNVKNNSWTY
jgi:hypothetical protein